jgi:hypothetical protein
MKTSLERNRGILPQVLQGTSLVQCAGNEPLSFAGNKVPYQPPVIEVCEVELESCIANGSAKLKDTDTTQFQIEDYTDQNVNASGDIELL